MRIYRNRSLAILLAIACHACKDDRASTSMSSLKEQSQLVPGIPEGWKPSELETLRSGEWRFFRLQLEDESSSVRERHLVLKADRPMQGVAGLSELIEDHGLIDNPRVIPPPKLAGQLAVFFVHATSRSSNTFKVVNDPDGDIDLDRLEKRRFGRRLEYFRAHPHPPVSSASDQKDEFIHRCWILEAVGLFEWQLTADRQGRVKVTKISAIDGKRQAVRD